MTSIHKNPAVTAVSPAAGKAKSPTAHLRLLGVIVMVAGAILTAAGITTYTVVSATLADERITVSQDAAHFAGDEVDGPFSAFSEAQTIEKHALEASGGKTYAELDREDPTRPTVMNGSFLRASLFTSVVSFGIAAMAVGLGILFMLIGWALVKIEKGLALPRAVPAA
jgi:uncharacterized protein YjeT (DUF2065 family)